MKQLLKQIKKVLEYIRNLKYKLTHDNLFDMSFGAILACVGLWLYLNVIDMNKLIIIVVPFLFSFLNEILNIVCGQRKIMWIDIFFRCIISVVIYFIIR